MYMKAHQLDPFVMKKYKSCNYMTSLVTSANIGLASMLTNELKHMVFKLFWQLSQRAGKTILPMHLDSLRKHLAGA
jgi:hypothetical protein